MKIMDCGHRPLSRCQRHSTAGTVKSDAVPIVPDVEDVFEDYHDLFGESIYLCWRVLKHQGCIVYQHLF